MSSILNKAAASFALIFKIPEAVVAPNRRIDMFAEKIIYIIGPSQIDSAALARKKLVMDEAFEKNRKQIGDEDFQYDVEVDFGNDKNADGEIESFDWDEDEDDNGDF